MPPQNVAVKLLQLADTAEGKEQYQVCYFIVVQ